VVNECDPKKVAINPVCYPQAEQGDVVDRYEEKVGNGVKEVDVRFFCLFILQIIKILNN
jgi:hypothetical protein